MWSTISSSPHHKKCIGERLCICNKMHWWHISSQSWLNLAIHFYKKKPPASNKTRHVWFTSCTWVDSKLNCFLTAIEPCWSSLGTETTSLNPLELVVLVRVWLLCSNPPKTPWFKRCAGTQTGTFFVCMTFILTDRILREKESEWKRDQSSWVQISPS